VETANEIEKIITAKTDQPSSVRIYVAGMGWSGPSFGIALDELKDEDKSYDFEGVNFIMEGSLHDQFGDFKVEYSGGGYMVVPVNQEPSDCGSCSGSC
jgi:Fe-S cluster assembly iron-binding protein IscA